MKGSFLKVKGLGLLAAAGVAAVLLAGCGADTRPAQPSPSTTPTVPSAPLECGSCDGQPQADHAGPGTLDLDPVALDAAKKTASDVMAAYTANKPKAEWFAVLAPLLTTQYGQEARYIDPSRLPAKKVTSGPELEAGVSTGYQVRAVFGTNAGEWVVILTRTSAAAPWLASNILPVAEAQ